MPTKLRSGIPCRTPRSIPLARGGRGRLEVVITLLGLFTMNLQNRKVVEPLISPRWDQTD
jgi:hypothetical protein